MKHVRSKSFLLSLISFAFLAGCEDPAVEVASLGKKLAAPTLKSASPFDQTFDDNNYVHMNGVCDNRVGDLSVSFVIGTSTSTGTTGTTGSGPTAAQVAAAAMYHSPALNNDITDTTLQTAPVNDINCADGVFDFYVTKKDIAAIWGFDTSDKSIEVSQILLKGSTLIGDTQVLVMKDNKNNGGGSSNIATKIVLEKQWPRGFATGNRCESFNVFLTDGNGNFASAASDTTFSISKSIAGSSSTVFGYSNWNDCNSNLNGSVTPIAGVNSFTIPKGQNSVQVVVLMPSSGYDSTYGYQAVSSGLTSAAADPVTLRDPASDRSYIAVDPGGNQRIHKDICYPISFSRTFYNSSYNSSSSANATIAASNSNLKFYADSSCATGVTSQINFPSAIYSANLYVKYTSVSSDSSDERIKVIMTPGSSSEDGAPFFIDVDKTGSATISQVDYWGPNETPRGLCTAYTVVLTNNHWASLPAATNVIVTPTSTAGGGFYSDATCSTSVSSVAFLPGDLKKAIYYKSQYDIAPGVYNLTMSSTGLTSMSRAVTVKPGNAISFSFNMVTGSASALEQDQCKTVRLYTNEASGAYSAYTPISYNYAISGISDVSSVKFYTDSSCSTVASANQVVQPTNTQYYTLYIKSANVADSSIYLNLTVQFAAGNSSTQNYPLGLVH